MELPEELLYACAEQALAQDVPSLLRFLQSSRSLRNLFEPLRRQAEERRLRWEAALTTKHTISEDGCTLTKVGGNYSVASWAAGSLLPMAGKSAWKVRIEESDGNEGLIWIGVCDAAAPWRASGTS